MLYKFLVAFLFLLNIQTSAQDLESLFNSKKDTVNSIQNIKDKADFLYESGVYFYSKNINKSEYFFNQASLLLKDKRNTMEGKVLWKLGFIEKNKGDLGTSLKYFFEAMKIFKDTEDHKRYASILFDIGYVYRYKKQEHKELEYYKKGITLSKNQSEELLAKGYIHFGNLYTRQNKLDSAYYFLNRALKIFKRENNTKRIHNVYNHLCNLYYKQGKYKQVITTRNVILTYAKQEKNNLLTTVNYHNIGTAYNKLKKYNIASTYLDSALYIAEKERFKVRLSKSYKSKASNDYKLKKHKQAYKNYIKHKMYSDSIYKSQLINRLKEVELENKLKIETKNLQIINQKQAYEQKIYLILFTLFIVLSILIGILFYRNSVNRNKITLNNLEKEKIKKRVLFQKFKKSETEIKGLAADNSMRLEFLKQLLNQLKKQKHLSDPAIIKSSLKDLTVKIQQQISTESKLTLLKEKINSINDGFENKLVATYGELTKTEREVCLLLRLNLSIKEIASIRNVSTDAIKATRYRIRKKMNIPKNQKLELFIKNLSK